MTTPALIAAIALIAFVLLAGAALAYAAWSRRQVHDPRNHVQVDQSSGDPVPPREVSLGPSRGVDRVPERFRDQPRPVDWIVQHEYAPKTGYPVNAKPYRNPDRVKRLAKNGRLRAELRT